MLVRRSPSERERVHHVLDGDVAREREDAGDHWGSSRATSTPPHPGRSHASPGESTEQVRHVEHALLTGQPCRWRVMHTGRSTRRPLASVW